jgi:hypothetical protein
MLADSEYGVNKIFQLIVMSILYSSYKKSKSRNILLRQANSGLVGLYSVPVLIFLILNEWSGQ